MRGNALIPESFNAIFLYQLFDYSQQKNTNSKSIQKLRKNGIKMVLKTMAQKRGESIILFPAYLYLTTLIFMNNTELRIVLVEVKV